MHHRIARCVAALIVVAFLSSAALAHTFSIDKDSAVMIDGDFLPADILTPGPYLHVDFGTLGLLYDGEAIDDLNALSAGRDSFSEYPIFFFSVDRNSVGINGSPATPAVSDVFTEAAAGQAAGDVFVTSFGHPGVPAWVAPAGQNMLHINQSEVGLNPVILQTTSYTGQAPIADLDALNFSEFDLYNEGYVDENVYFSLALGSASLDDDVTADDILVYLAEEGFFEVFADGVEDIGLQEGDDIDALVLLDQYDRGYVNVGDDLAFFSLAPGSPTLTEYGYSAADIFYTEFDGWFSLAYTAAELGLLATDNVNALETQPGTEAIPEPGTLLLLVTGGVALIGRLRRRRPA